MKNGFFFDPDEIMGNKRVSRFSTHGCSACGLYSKCKSPKMKSYGQFKKRILIVAQAPGETEDEKNRQLCGKAGNYLKRCLANYNIDMDRDCLLENTISCRPPNNRKPKPEELAACFPRLEKVIKEAKPKLILVFGEKAIQQVLDPPQSLSFSVGTIRGFVVPKRKWNAWVAALYHPSYILRSGGEQSDLHEFFLDDLHNALSYLDKILEWPIDESVGNHLVTKFDVAQCLFYDRFANDAWHCIETAFDYETNKLSPYAKDAKILTISVGTKEEAFCIPIEHREAEWTSKELNKIKGNIKKFLTCRNPKIIQNFNFEDIWSREYFGVPVNNCIHDTMMGQHVLDNRPSITGLDFQSFIINDTDYFETVDKRRINETPLPIVANYSCLDSRYAYLLYTKQIKRLEEQPNLKRAYKLFHKSLPLFSRFSHKGIKVDEKKMAELKEQFESKSENLDKIFQKTEASKKFKDKHKYLPDINGRNDLIELFYEICGIPIVLTKKKNPQLNKDVLLDIAAKKSGRYNAGKIAENILEWRRTEKILSTYIPDIEKYLHNNLIHPNFNLHFVRTYRGSSDSPNFQNQPRRDPESFKLRQIYVPKLDIFVEGDYAGNEVRHLAMYCKDSNLIKFLKEGRDFHREWAARIYGKSLKEVTIDERYKAKNQFVFPAFYGRIAENVARVFKVSIDKAQGWLDRLWRDFPDIPVWQKDMLAFYQRHGYIEMKTGFRCYGPMGEREIYNYVVQGSAFHSLLAGLLEVNRELESQKAESHCIAQIHDSGFYDVVENEKKDVCNLVKKCFTRVRWDWQKIVPMEVKLSQGYNWYNMEKMI